MMRPGSAAPSRQETTSSKAGMRMGGTVGPNGRQARRVIGLAADVVRLFVINRQTACFSLSLLPAMLPV